MSGTHTAVINYCETTLRSQLTSYIQDYNSNMYSWSTCDYYYYDYSQTDCSIRDIRYLILTILIISIDSTTVS